MKCIIAIRNNPCHDPLKAFMHVAIVSSPMLCLLCCPFIHSDLE